MTARSTPLSRAAFSHWQPIQTRWADNDCYGHVNNVVYYSWFDTAVNRFLLEQAGMKPGGHWLGLVVHTHCDYFAPVAFPQVLEVGLRVASRGTSSVRYELAIFALDSPAAAAQGHFVHVYVDAGNRRPLSILPPSLGAALLPLSLAAEG